MAVQSAAHVLGVRPRHLPLARSTAATCCRGPAPGHPSRRHIYPGPFFSDIFSLSFISLAHSLSAVRIKYEVQRLGLQRLNLSRIGPQELGFWRRDLRLLSLWQPGGSALTETASEASEGSGGGSEQQRAVVRLPGGAQTNVSFSGISCVIAALFHYTLDSPSFSLIFSHSLLSLSLTLSLQQKQ